MKGGRIPDANAVSAHIAGMDVGATLRGIELCVEGTVQIASGKLVLRVSDEETIPLEPLTQKIDWDHAKKRARTPSRDEKSAFSRLKRAAQNNPKRLLVTGPLRSVDGRPSCLEVRHFKSIGD